MAGIDEPPTLSEISRTISDFRAEVRGQFGQLVRADVYGAERSALLQRLDTLERDLQRVEADRSREADTAAATRRMMMAAVIGAAASLVATLMAILLR
jgi:hypothetical protein